jgi:hypothetical protein
LGLCGPFRALRCHFLQGERSEARNVYARAQTFRVAYRRAPIGSHVLLTIAGS